MVQTAQEISQNHPKTSRVYIFLEKKNANDLVLILGEGHHQE